MLTCKQVSNALASEDYEKLPSVKKFFLKLHVKLCVFCGKFNRQVMDSQDMCRCYKEHEGTLHTAWPRLHNAKKDQLKKKLLSSMPPQER